MAVFMIVLVSLICLSIFGTFFNSILSRRKQGVYKQIYRARMNVNMGIMFISIAILQIISIPLSVMQGFLMALVFGLGSVNLYYGIKNGRYYKHIQSRQEA
ncbi:MAG: YtpI family protein [Thermoactinomyces sp.]